MKRFILGLSILFLLLTIPGRVYAEEIFSFHSDIKIEDNGSIVVTEGITYNFGTLERHGIFRNIPYIKTNEDGKKFQLLFEDFRVTDGQLNPIKFTQTKENGYIKLKIGDPDKTITGEQPYVISYRVSGALTYFSNHTELYWNVSGNEWEIPIHKSSARVNLPKQLEEKDIRLACFTGPEGSSDSNCMYFYPGVAAFQTTAGLDAYEGMTIVVGFPLGLVAHLDPKPYVTFWETPFGQILSAVLIALGVILGFIWYLVAPIYILYGWYRYGRDPRPPMGVTSAWFDPPKTKSKRKLSPGETGALVDEQADMRDIFATIVDLARRGYLKIIENKKNDYSLMLTTESVKDDTLLQHERDMFYGIFKSKDLLKLKGADLIDEVKKVQKGIYSSLVTEDFFPSSPQSIRDKYLIVAGLALFTLNLPLALMAFTFGQAMPRKTMRGAQEAAVAKSLKNFLISQDEKLEYQAKNFMFFEKFLPYAIAFGVEKIWADRFKDIAMKSPDWYVGSTHGGHFNSSSFTRSLGSSFAGVSKAATPTSSSTGHSSGFSGGSSGGGGGGGGGGSW